MKKNNKVNVAVLRENYRMYLTIKNISCLALISHALFIPLFLWLGVNSLAVLNVASVAAWAAAFIQNNKGHHGKAILFAVLEVFVHCNSAALVLGWDAGFYLYYFLIIPFIFLNHNQKTYLVVFEAIFFLLSFFCLHYFTHQLGALQTLSPAVSDGLLFMNTAAIFVAFSVMGYFFRVASIHAEHEMEKLATTDSLTGLFNRRKMHELLEMERLRYQRIQHPFIISIGDIDHFKSINDQYGHDFGDAVLKHVSAIIQKTLRKTDNVARWGGEEFLIMLTDTESGDGLQVIEKVRLSVAQSPCYFNDQEIAVTMTFGVATFDGSNGLEAVIKQADQALYRGKAEGRNQVNGINALEKLC